MGKIRQHESARSKARREGGLPPKKGIFDRVAYPRMSGTKQRLADKAIKAEKVRQRKHEVQLWYEEYGLEQNDYIYQRSTFGYRTDYWDHLGDAMAQTRGHIAANVFKSVANKSFGLAPVKAEGATVSYDLALPVNDSEWYEIDFYELFDIHGEVEYSPDGKWFRI